MDTGLAGAAVVITGGGSGIGLACAEAFAREGARVAVLDRDPAAGERVASVPGALAAVADVRDEVQVRKAIEKLAEGLGAIDVLVCCAGVSGPFGDAVAEIELDDWDEVMEVNVRGAFVATKHCLPYLRRSSRPAIVLLASDSSYVAAPGMVPYCASKGALLMLARALSVDLADDGIRVNCVSPSIVDTPLARDDLGLPDGFVDVSFPVHMAEQVARQVVFLASPLAETVNGASLVSDFGYLARSAFPA